MERMVKNFIRGPGWCGSVDWVLAWEPMGYWFDCPVRAHALVAAHVSSRGCVRGNHTWVFLSLSFSLPSLYQKINKVFKKKKGGLQLGPQWNRRLFWMVGWQLLLRHSILSPSLFLTLSRRSSLSCVHSVPSPLCQGDSLGHHSVPVHKGKPHC